MKILAIVVLVLVVGFITVQIMNFSGRDAVLSKEFSEVQDKLDKATENRDQLKAELSGYDKPAQIEQTAREKLNYRRPDEKMLIIVPPHESTTPPVR